MCWTARWDSSGSGSANCECEWEWERERDRDRMIRILDDRNSWSRVRDLTAAALAAAAQNLPSGFFELCSAVHTVTGIFKITVVMYTNGWRTPSYLVSFSSLI